MIDLLFRFQDAPLPDKRFPDRSGLLRTHLDVCPIVQVGHGRVTNRELQSRKSEV